ncbi:MAG: hypothetical protein VYA60_05050 [Pseudomonadota bacterium]|nr:hypothetical protein [Pseudomonadota bacterium]
MNDEIKTGLLNEDVTALNKAFNVIFLSFSAIATAFCLTGLGLLYIG